MSYTLHCPIDGAWRGSGWCGLHDVRTIEWHVAESVYDDSLRHYPKSVRAAYGIAS